MKLIDREGRLFGKISIIDVLVLAVVIVMAVALYVKTNHREITSTTTSDTPFTYQILVSGVRGYVADAIREKDMLYDVDNSSGGALGEITDIQVMEGAKLAEYEHNGWAARDGHRWRLTPIGFLLSNQLIGELLERQESATLETTLPKVQKTPPPPPPPPPESSTL